MEKKYLALGLILIIVPSIIMVWNIQSTKFSTSEKLKIVMTIDSGSWKKVKEIDVVNGTTVFDVLNNTFNVEYKKYEGMGIFVTSIEGTEQNSTHYWIYFVDGVPGNVSADNFVLYKDLNITWKLMSLEESMKLFS